jgi:hypothetical protein
MLEELKERGVPKAASAISVRRAQDVPLILIRLHLALTQLQLTTVIYPLLTLSIAISIWGRSRYSRAMDFIPPLALSREFAS